MNPSPFVSVIIPTYHDWGRLKLCLAAIKAQSYPADRFEVLVVNNDPQDLPPYEVATGNIHLLEEAKPGSYSARNAAIQVAKGEMFAFTDSDCIPDHDWLLKGVELIQSGAYRVGGAIELLADASDTIGLPAALQICIAFRQDRNVKNGWAATANMIAVRQCFVDVGSFDDDLLSGGDKDWGERAYRKSLKIDYCAQSKVYHPVRATWKELLKKQRRIVGGIAKVNKRKGKANYLFFLARQLLPPIRACFFIIRENKKKSVLTKSKALFAVFILKFYGLFILLQIILGVRDAQRD
jgi:glycosyltransferase involved in cell wall biosynthesis